MFTLEEVKSAMEFYGGFCTACGAEADCCEPDLCNRRCESCGEHKVFGAEMLIIMDLVN